MLARDEAPYPRDAIEVPQDNLRRGLVRLQLCGQLAASLIACRRRVRLVPAPAERPACPGGDRACCQQRARAQAGLAAAGHCDLGPNDLNEQLPGIERLMERSKSSPGRIWPRLVLARPKRYPAC